MQLGAIVLDTDESEKLADFYARLLKWEKTVQYHEGEKWLIVASQKGAGVPLVFQEVASYQRPVWPEQLEKQQQMLHLDFYVSKKDFEQEIEHALKCGATLSPIQLSPDWQVFFDPSGHPFCIIPLP